MTRARIRRSLIRGLTCLAIAGAGGAAFLHWQTERCWRELEQAVGALAQEHGQLPHHRPPAWGEPVQDLAWPHYAEAVRLVTPMMSDGSHDELVRTLRRTDAEVALDESGLRARWQPILAALHAGAHATDTQRDSANLGKTANLLTHRWIANMAAFEARALLSGNRDDEAVQWTLDGATLASDLARHGTLIDQMIGCATFAICTSEVWTEARLAQLRPEALELLATGLARLDESLPPCLDFATEHLAMGRLLLDAKPDAEWLPQTLWTTLGQRWLLADAWLQAAAATQALEQSTDQPWPERRRRLESPLPSRLLPNPVLAMIVPNWSAAESNRRGTLARLRLLRASIAVHRGEPAPAVADPLGEGALVTVAEPGGIQLTSAGSTPQQPLVRFVAR